MPPNANESFDQFNAILGTYGPRMVAALIAGAIIGLENQIYAKPAGLRTNIILCLGCALITIISIASGIEMHDSTTRITAQILTGIGFLGGGVILQHNDRIKGITTAATIFVNAAIGITVGSGFIFSGVAAALLVALVLILLKPVDRFVETFPYFVKLRQMDLITEHSRKKRDQTIEQIAAQVAENTKPII
jgi:putative Mg2+ transporter-C (MgtC) family protein